MAENATKGRNTPKEKSLKEVLIYLNEVTGKLKINIVLLMILQSVSSVVSIFYAFALRDIVNAATAGDLSLFISKIAGFAALVLIQLALSAINSCFTTYTSTTLENRFKERLLATILDKDYGSVSALHSGEWMTRLNSDASAVASSVLQWIPSIVSTVVRLAGVVAAIAVMEPLFLLLIIPGGIIYIFVPYLFRNIRQRFQRENREKSVSLRVFLQDTLSNLILVRSYSVEAQAEEQADEKMNDIRRTHIRQNLFSTAYNSGFSLLTRCGYIIVVLICGYQILIGRIDFGTFTALLQLVSQLRGPLSNIGSFVTRYYSLMINIERLMEAEDMPKSDEDEPLPFTEIKEFYSEKFEGLGLKDVSFSYPPPVKNKETVMPLVLDGLSVDIKKGDYVALVGKSGCGKSTFLKLLMCLYPLDSGERYTSFLKNDNVKNEDQDAVFDHMVEHLEPLTSKYKRLFAYVPQGDTFMSGTVREIVAFSDREATYDDARINAAINTACADDFVYKMEKGVDTELGENGLGLSEGQLQRLSIARAVFSGRPILLLDECTSALDEETERKLLDNLKDMTDRTVFIVTHRKAALDICDKIIRFLPDGNVMVENTLNSDADDVNMDGSEESYNKSENDITANGSILTGNDIAMSSNGVIS